MHGEVFFKKKMQLDDIDLETELILDSPSPSGEPEKAAGGCLEASLFDIDVAGAHVKLYVTILRTFFFLTMLQYVLYTFATYLIFSTGALKVIPSWIVSDLNHESAQQSNSLHWMAERNALLIILMASVVTFLFIYTILWAVKRSGWFRWIMLTLFMIGKVFCLGVIAIVLDDLAPIQVCLNLSMISMALLAYCLAPNGRNPTTFGAFVITGIMTLVTWLFGLYAYIVQRHVALVMLIPMVTFLGGLGLVYMVTKSESAQYLANEKPLFFLDYHLLIIDRAMHNRRPETHS